MRSRPRRSAGAWKRRRPKPLPDVHGGHGRQGPRGPGGGKRCVRRGRRGHAAPGCRGAPRRGDRVGPRPAGGESRRGAGSARRATLREMVRRRIRREPVAYIVGHKGFRHLELAIDRRALIPRPETELLVEVALELEPRTVLDVGTGSGAIALAVADELPECEVLATDTSEEALALARDRKS